MAELSELAKKKIEEDLFQDLPTYLLLPTFLPILPHPPSPATLFFKPDAATASAYANARTVFIGFVNHC